MATKRMFLVKVKIKTNNWDYKVNDIIHVPVISTGKVNALNKFEKECWGSEYPIYEIIGIYECDTFLFKPIL